MSEWQTIETAPADTKLLLCWLRTWPHTEWEFEMGLAECTRGGWLNGRATHWMPLPAPPSDITEETL